GNSIWLRGSKSGGCFSFFFQAEDGIRGRNVTGVQTLLFRSIEEIISLIDPAESRNSRLFQLSREGQMTNTCAFIFAHSTPEQQRDRKSVVKGKRVERDSRSIMREESKGESSVGRRQRSGRQA